MNKPRLPAIDTQTWPSIKNVVAERVMKANLAVPFYFYMPDMILGALTTVKGEKRRAAN